MRWAAKRDGNEPEIIQAAQMAGWKVFQISLPDWPDLLCAKPGKVRFLEVKTPKGRIRPGQASMFLRLASAGLPVAIVRSAEEAAQALGR
jgi:hypothetical protein